MSSTASLLVEMIPTFLAIALAMKGLPPITIVTLIPALCHSGLKGINY